MARSASLPSRFSPERQSGRRRHPDPLLSRPSHRHPCTTVTAATVGGRRASFDAKPKDGRRRGSFSIDVSKPFMDPMEEAAAAAAVAAEAARAAAEAGIQGKIEKELDAQYDSRPSSTESSAASMSSPLASCKASFRLRRAARSPTKDEAAAPEPTAEEDESADVEPAEPD
jgi:hypothetical protein